MSENFSKERIVKNSLLLYVRMLFTMWLNLYATRLTLANLGIEDMGVYGVIGSIVSLFTVFTGGITSAVQRFITFELGLKDGQPNKVFCSSLNVIFILSGLILVLLEVGGLWMLENKVNIPEASRAASFWVFQLSVLTCLVNLISIPYNALIIAHEKMNAFAVISIVQVVLNFLAAYSLSLFENNRLLIYSVLLAVIGIFIRLLYQVYCHRMFAEARYHFGINWDTIKQIGKFTGVTTVSGMIEVVTSQGLVFVINLVFGVAINAVYSIASQLKNSIWSFAMNVQRAIAPQITKTYANQEMNLYKKLIYSGSKLEIYLILLIIIPFLFRTHAIMALWLENVPEHMVTFAQSIVFVTLFHVAMGPMHEAVLATNNISKYLIIPNSFYLIAIPIGYVIGKYTNSPDLFIIITVIINIVSILIRLIYICKVTCLKIRSILEKIFLPSITIAGCSTLFCYLYTLFLGESFVDILTLVVLNGVSLLIVIPLVGLTKQERGPMLNLIRKIIKNKNIQA